MPAITSAGSPTSSYRQLSSRPLRQTGRVRVTYNREAYAAYGHLTDKELPGGHSTTKAVTPPGVKAFHARLGADASSASRCSTLTPSSPPTSSTGQRRSRRRLFTPPLDRGADPGCHYPQVMQVSRTRTDRHGSDGDDVQEVLKASEVVGIAGV